MTDELPARPQTPTEPETDLEIDVDLDPVCGAAVDPEEAALRSLSLEYEGRTYLFCGRDCRARFEHAPERFAAAGRAEP